SCFPLLRLPPTPPLFPYTTLFRSYADPDLRGQLAPLFVAAVKPGEETFIDQLRRRHADPEERAQAEAEIMLRKNWSALGSFIKEDRKSTRLNSSHVAISYAVFCLK